MREILQRQEVQQLLRDIAAFRASLAELRACTTLDDSLCCLADAIECYGWIGAGASRAHATSMLNAFRTVDSHLAAIDPEEVETAFRERLVLWRVAEGMGLLRANVLGQSLNPMVELLYNLAEITTDGYLRLAIAWTLYARKSGVRELSLLYMAFRDAKLYHLEERYRIRHRQQRDANHRVQSDQERREAIARALEQSDSERLGIPELNRELKSLHALLRSSLQRLEDKRAVAQRRGGERASAEPSLVTR